MTKHPLIAVPYSSQPGVLIVDDEPLICDLLQLILERAGYTTAVAAGSDQALARLASEPFALMLTDLQLGYGDGVRLAGRVREIDPEIEIIILTGYATLDSAIAAMRHGVRGYLLKPWRNDEVLRTVAAAFASRRYRDEQSLALEQLCHDLSSLAERSMHYTTPRSTTSPLTHWPAGKPPAPGGNLLQVGALTIEPGRRLARIAGRSLQLSKLEFAILAYLAARPDQVITAQQIIQAVMGYACSPAEARDLLKVRIWAIRRQLEADPRRPRMLLNIRGAGYMLTSDTPDFSTPFCGVSPSLAG